MTRTATAGTRDDAIAVAALEIADRMGIRGLTIRRVAEEVGKAPMTIYGTVSSKEELYGVAARRAFDDLVLPKLESSWRDNIVAVMVAYRDLMMKHPSLPQIMAIQRVSLSAVGLSGLMDAVLCELERGQVAEEAIVRGMFNLTKFALGYVLFELGRRNRNEDETGHKRKPVKVAELDDVLELAAEHSFTYLHRYASRVMNANRPDSYEDGIRTLLAGLPLRTK